MVAPVQKGDVLGGKFRVERVLGTGGMGVIVAAFHLQLEQLVALKFLLPEAAKDKEVVTRFAREARAAAKIQSEHVARVLDVGVLETGAPYMVMEYLEGEDLDVILKRRRQMPIPEAVGHVLQACEAVAEAHSLGIVHRDLKPANLFLAERADGSDSIKVLDFGISKVLPEGSQVDDASLTRTRTVMGSPMYMSPEQLRSARDVDVRADIWSLGVILYEMLGGKGPFSTGNVAEVCAAILKDAPEPLRELLPEVPPALEAIINRCLEKDPSKRYANVAELATELLFYGPPGAERSLERISRVLRKSGGRATERPRSDRASETDFGSAKSEVPLELAETKASGAIPAPIIEQTAARPPAPPDASSDRGLPSAPPATDVSATASASTISSWRGQGIVERKVPRPAYVAAGVVGSLILGVLIIAFAGGSSDRTRASSAFEPSQPAPLSVEPPRMSPSPVDSGATPTPTRAAAPPPAHPAAPARPASVPSTAVAPSTTPASTSSPTATASAVASPPAATAASSAPKPTSSSSPPSTSAPTAKPK